MWKMPQITVMERTSEEPYSWNTISTNIKMVQDTKLGQGQGV